MAQILIRTASLSVFFVADGVTLPYSGNVAFGGNSFILNVSLDANNNRVIKNALTGSIVIPSTNLPVGGSVTLSVNGNNYTLYNLPDHSPIQVETGAPFDYPVGVWGRSKWGRARYGNPNG